LVTIVIMVTVLAGVIPMLSPNNDSRKIREASRQLNSLLAQAQAQAARNGRPVGVAFRESTSGTRIVDGQRRPIPSGMALAAYIIAEPLPFAGFSEWSRVVIARDPANATYGPPNEPNVGDNANGNGGERFESKCLGWPLYNVGFIIYNSPDPFPPRTFRIGDTIDVGGNEFLIVDDADQTMAPNMEDPDAPGFLLADAAEPVLSCVWTNYHGQAAPQGARAYKIRRQPTNASDEPLQFPRGIGIDLQGSGVNQEVNLPGQTFPTQQSFDDNSENDTVGIMFGPSGAVTDFYFNGQRINRVEQIFLLVGKIESGNVDNGTPAVEDDRYNFSDVQDVQIADDGEVDRRRREVNWTDPDAQWVTVAARSGRIITSENRLTDLRDNKTDGDDDGDPFNQDAGEQIRAARRQAEQMLATGGR